MATYVLEYTDVEKRHLMFHKIEAGGLAGAKRKATEYLATLGWTPHWKYQWKRMGDMKIGVKHWRMFSYRGGKARAIDEIIGGLQTN